VDLFRHVAFGADVHAVHFKILPAAFIARARGAALNIELAGAVHLRPATR
jgi:hypothetical protein